MEKEGLKRCVTFLVEHGFTIHQLVTDRHRQIGKWIRENLPETQHVFDVWHVAKGLHSLIRNLHIYTSMHVFISFTLQD